MAQRFTIAASSRVPTATLGSRLCLVVAFSLSLLSIAGAEEDASSQPPGTSLTWTLEASHVALSSRDPDFYVRIRIKAAKGKPEARQPLTLALVFDRSGSMDAEQKIGYVQKAGHLVADNLKRDDYLAMVAFNHEVQTLVPLHPVVNREYLHHRVDELYAEGYTNLSGGLMDGCAQVNKRLEEPGLHHVILLTDGVANRGVWQPKELLQLTERLTRNGITVTTVGVGTDFNEALLGQMAQVGGGRYIYVAKPEDIPTAFATELGSLLAVVAQNTKLKMTLPPGVEVRQIFGWERPQKSGQVELPLGDLAIDEKRVILAKMRFKADPDGGINEALRLQATLTYDDVDSARRKEEEQVIAIERSNGSSQTTPVLAYAQLAEAVDKIALAVAGMDREIAAEVLRFERAEYPALRRASRDQEFVNKAFMFEHYARELQELVDRGALHEHSQERAQLQKELHYRQYLMRHHQHGHGQQHSH